MALRSNIPEAAKRHFCAAWWEIGKEPPEDVKFVPVRDFVDGAWAQRRFESDWSPDTPSDTFHARRYDAICAGQRAAELTARKEQANDQEAALRKVWGDDFLG